MAGRVIVAGSINMDIVASASRFPRSGETVAGKGQLLPGGKGANQAVAAAKSGAPTALIGRLGDDAFGHELRAFLFEQRVDLTHVGETEQTSTGTAIITVSDAQQHHRGRAGCQRSGRSVGRRLRRSCRPAMSPGQPARNPGPRRSRRSSARGRAAGARTILNPAPALAARSRSPWALADIVVAERDRARLSSLATRGSWRTDEPALNR